MVRFIFKMMLLCSLAFSHCAFAEGVYLQPSIGMGLNNWAPWQIGRQLSISAIYKDLGWQAGASLRQLDYASAGSVTGLELQLGPKLDLFSIEFAPYLALGVRQFSQQNELISYGNWGLSTGMHVNDKVYVSLLNDLVFDWRKEDAKVDFSVAFALAYKVH